VAGLLAIFLAGVALLSAAGGTWAEREVLSEQRAQHGWHQVTAQVTSQTPARASLSSGFLRESWARAQWTDPAGHPRTHLIPVNSQVPAGKTVQIWVNATGQWSGPPLSDGMAQLRVAAMALLPPAALAIFLLTTGLICRRVANQRRLATWDKAWALIGPQWTREFWAQS
jgi:hypothetical protein